MYFVTGGAGFIGSNLVASLSARDERVVVCDRLGDQDKWRNLAHHDLDDIVAPERAFDLLDARVDAVQAVVHMGAISATTETDGDRLVETNFRLSRDLWRWCTQHEVPLIYASSAATYGDGARGFEDTEDRAALARFRPLNGYGWSKQLFDRWVARELADGAARPPQWAGLKFFNVYGPNEYHKGGQASVPWHLFQQIQAGGPAKLFKSHHPDYPDGGQLRDFVYVDDCIAVMRWLLDTPRVSGLFNVGTGRARTFLALAHAVFDALDREPDIAFVPTPERLRPTYQYFTQASMEKLRKAGYDTPFTELEDGIAAYVRAYLTAPDPYR
ncbi:ADP-glyceromanno-heptose 6-epimerase [Rhodovibrio sodomensis]|uniref:ADP-L-glycero-D-manno-heptose-6-epimerase n=1 Tax=Rhodovibrio sodomensis TaxID=1088 RepID=A0ABS1DNS8_9PROT|nr:ADP-glyceromanno-heptose 6-epimerase [Rhodovibrio sodomensis]MBK1671378.1 ADP-glyceromanno-heptose 6-epimerase [Rhodovibrio sodomensis]